MTVSLLQSFISLGKPAFKVSEIKVVSVFEKFSDLGNFPDDLKELFTRLSYFTFRIIKEALLKIYGSICKRPFFLSMLYYYSFKEL